MDLKKITYQQFKSIANEKYNSINIHFAFNEEQYKNILEKLEVKKGEESDKICKVGGGIMLKTEVHLLGKYYKWFNEQVDSLMKRDSYVYQMFYYEFSNHEAQISGDYEEVAKEFVSDLEDPRINKIYQKAKTNHWLFCIKNDQF
ncbi:DUF7659 family protein [Tenacibaculum maritimum]|uniref:DUF7659 family protein n=1 Tax=Tenacibaculum maritimum TaxID=107401 RepID=UPI003875B5A3